MKETIGAAGGFVWVLAAVTATLVTLSAVCAAMRVRRIVAVAMLLAAILPFGVGMLGVLKGRQHVWRTMEALVAPTPRDLSWGRATSDACLFLGSAGTIVCAVAALFALVRSRRPAQGDDPLPAPSAVWNPK